MNFTQLQERVRLELLRRIERGTMSVSLLARQTGLGQPHVSNFLHGRRGLSLGTLDRILAAQRLTAMDLLPAPREARGDLLEGQIGEVVQIPLVSHAVAMGDWYVRVSNVQATVAFPAGLVRHLRERCTPARKQWERFVALRVSGDEAREMEPLLGADAVLLLDRHYNSFRAYRERAGEGGPNVYAVRVGEELRVRYADFQAGRVVLRPLGMGFPVELIEPGGGETANDLLVGRVAVVLREC
jgi:transcriptional regulator with XRE-family HTH domain